MIENSSRFQKIDVEQLLESKLGKKAGFIPDFVVDGLRKLVCQEHLNHLLERNIDKRGAEFCHGVLADMGVNFTVRNTENLPDPADSRVIYVSNHPLGGLDGLILIDFLTGYHGKEVRFVVNDLLAAIKPMESLFIPVNKHGAQGRDTVRKVNEAFAGDAPIVMFPAGLCSRRASDGTICDLEWQKMFVIKAIQSGRPVIPLYFSGHNSSFFYKFAQWRVRLGIRFNYEMILLPREMVRGEGKTYTITVGKPISTDWLKSDSPAEVARKVRDIVRQLDPDGSPGQ
ncbi:MAG: 1-acyl-sn-glycerol-3-phosphate acyltransferase [Muribaculaceae bacterium]|nr:1-acyl-sn-glycerol-3-phosphate acyltransferase [Muribaculaceae bacterium]